MPPNRVAVAQDALTLRQSGAVEEVDGAWITRLNHRPCDERPVGTNEPFVVLRAAPMCERLVAHKISGELHALCVGELLDGVLHFPLRNPRELAGLSKMPSHVTHNITAAVPLSKHFAAVPLSTNLYNALSGSAAQS